MAKTCQCPDPKACKKKTCGSWRATVNRYDASGKRVPIRQRGFPNKSAAQHWCADRIAELRDGSYVDDRGLTLEVFLCAWLDEKWALKTIRLNTYDLYGQHVRLYLVPHLGRVRLRDLGVTQLQRMFTQLSNEGHSPALLHRIRTTLRSALTTARKRGYIRQNWASDVDLPPEVTLPVDPWGARELGHFLDHVVDDRLSALFELAAATGMRRGEVCGLRWEDLKLDDAVITVVQQIVQNDKKDRPTPPCAHCAETHRGLHIGPPKTKSSTRRKVELDPETVNVLRLHQLRQDLERSDWDDDYSDHGLVFCKENGDPLRPNWVWGQFRKLSDAAGLRPTRLHDLRHAAVSLRLATYADMTVVSKSLGHSRVSLTEDIYGHLLKGVARGAAQSANAIVPRNRRTQSVPNSEEGTDVQ